MNKINKLIISVLFLLLLVNTAQAWQIEFNDINLINDVRFPDTVYWNNDSQPKIVTLSFIYMNTVDGETLLSIYINGSYISSVGVDYSGYLTNVYDDTVIFFVPAYSSYRVDVIENAPLTLSIITWYEWNTTDTPTEKEVKDNNVFLLIIAFCSVFIIMYIIYKEVVR